MATCVVTGGAGFVGQALVARLLARGDAVRAVVLPGDPRAASLREVDPGQGRLSFIEADVTAHASLVPAFAGAELVFHAAALIHAWAPWEKFRAVNVGGLRNVAALACEHGVKRLVHVSTSDVFGIPEHGEVLDEASPFRRWHEPYADTKIEAEEWLWAFRRDSGLPISVIYPGWVYGPGDRAFFPGLADAIRAGLMTFWCRDLRLAWVYVDNLVDACVLAASHEKALGEGYIVHDGDDGPTLEQVCARIAAAIGAPVPRRHVPYPLALAAARLLQSFWRLVGATTAPPLLPVDVKAFGRPFVLSAGKIRRDLGWRPEVGIEQGMRNALDFLRDGCQASRR